MNKISGAKISNYGMLPFEITQLDKKHETHYIIPNTDQKKSIR